MPDTRTFSPPSASFTLPEISPRDSNIKVVIVGAGVMGSWTALQFLRNGCNVTLVESWEPGNSISSSGGESRLIRAIYGEGILYTQLTLQSIKEWKELEKKQNKRLFHDEGVYWLLKEDSKELYKPPKDFMLQNSYPVDEVPFGEFETQYPFVQLDGVSKVLLEANAGFIEARKAVQATVNQFQTEGGHLVKTKANPSFDGSSVKHVVMNGEKLEADLYIFCLGPWMTKTFPELKEHITISRQEIHYFGFRQHPPDFRSFVDWDPEDIFYGVWNHDGRGLKVAHDFRGVPIDPDTEVRIPTEEEIKASVTYLEKRFPGLTYSSLSESRVCQYSNSVDGNFIIDKHPQYSNCWIVGGGSGHGFKMGPSIGQIVYELSTEQRESVKPFRLNR